MKKRQKNPNRIGVGKFWAWGSREISETASVLMGMYLLMYATNTLKLNPAVVGGLLAVTKIIDAVTDIIAGYIVDKTHTKLGKGRPYELCIIGVWVCTYLMYSCPPSISEVMKYVWVIAMYTMVNAIFMIFLNAGETVYMIRAFREEQVVRVSSFVGFINSAAGFAFNIITPQLIAKHQDEPGGWGFIVLCVGIPTMIISLMRFIFVKEKYDRDIIVKTEKIHIKDVFHVLRQNRYVWIIVFITFTGALSTSLGLGTFYFEEILGGIQNQSLISAITILALPMVFIFPKLVSKIKIRNIMILGSAVSMLGTLICFFANTSLKGYMLGWLFVSFGSLPATYLTRLMIFDCASYNEWKKMPRMEGTIGAVQGFAKRVGAAVSTALGGLMLVIIGYNADAVTSSAIMGLRVCNNLFPALISGLNIVVLLFYTLDAKMPKINEENVRERERILAEEAKASETQASDAQA